MKKVSTKDLRSIYIGKSAVPIPLDKDTREGLEKVAKEKRLSLVTAARLLIRERLTQLKLI